MRRMEKPQAKKLLEFSKKGVDKYIRCMYNCKCRMDATHTPDGQQKPLNLLPQVKRSGKEVTGCHSPSQPANIGIFAKANG